MTAVADDNSINGIAIIGMSGRFPGAKDVDTFWQNLRDGVESISTFSAADLISEDLDPGMLNYPGFINRGGVLEDVDLFDAAFFGYNPREAETTDPQHRLFLECAWEALESAGYDPEKYKGLVGVYGGVSMSKYVYNIFANPNLMALVGYFQVMLGNDKDHLTTRVAYKLNLRGPAVTVQTTCSTSLVATVMACQSLLDYQCDMALAGGAAISLPQRSGGVYQEGGISSPDGRCRAFDARAQGTVGGNGVGVILLKRYQDAVADRDFIHAVIRGAAMNNDGAVKVGYTAPSVDGQAQVIAMAQAMAKVSPDTITYVEAHGTGTPLGDPIEIAALTQAFQAQVSRRNTCAIGSVKTNVGHLDQAAGIAGLIKTVLSLEHRMLPPSLHFEQPNPKIDFANSPFYVNANLADWKTNGVPRRAGVSSFGIGGTNAHVVLEEAPPVTPAPSTRTWQLFPISARSPTALDESTRRLAAAIQGSPERSLADMAYTCAIGRRAFPLRRVAIGRSHAEVATALMDGEPRQVFSGSNPLPGGRQPVFLFSGQGTQYVQMARGLYETEATFREQVDLCAEILRGRLDLDLRQVIYPPAEEAELASDRLQQTSLTQPALFTVEYALAKLLMEWGLRPAAMIGHSIGEYVAACLAEVFSLKDALTLVAERGRLMQSTPPGGMLAVALPEQEALTLLTPELSLAVVNGPAQCVLSGPLEAVDSLEADLRARNVFCRRLRTSHAFHSAMMDPVLELFTQQAAALRLDPPKIPYLSNVSGTWITAEEAVQPQYWAAHLRSTVRFGDGLQQLIHRPEWVLLEVGPGHTLAALARDLVGKSWEELIFASLPPAREASLEPQTDTRALAESVARLWLAGVPVDWAGYYRHEQRSRLPLPTYPFERQRFWVGPSKPAAQGQAAAPPAEADISRWFYIPDWQETRPLTVSPGQAAAQDLHWLILGDPDGLGSALMARLKAEGAAVTLVLAADEYARLGDERYSLHTDRREDYEALLGEMRAAGAVPGAVIHLWSITSGDSREAGTGAFEQLQERGYSSLLALAQALGKTVINSPVQIGVVSNHLLHVLEQDRLQSEKAPVVGLCRVIPQEIPNLSCWTLDPGVLPADPDERQRLVDALLGEFIHRPGDWAVAYRGPRRLAQTIRPVPAGEALEAAPQLRKQGVYLITGGLGHIGLELAVHLASTNQARLVLAQRSSFPGRELWEGWLASHPLSDPTAQKIKKLQSILEAGGEVLVISADAADPAQMQTVVRRTVERFGALHGVIHAAGASGRQIARSLQEIDPEHIRLHFRPKIYGLYALEAALRGKELDFCLLFSSLSSLLGGLGFGAYAAANAFLDAFARAHHNPQGVQWISVDWDGWQFDGPTRPGAAPQVERSIYPEEGLRAFRRALALAPQVVVATGDLPARIQKWVRLETVKEKIAPPEGMSQAQHTRPNLPTEYVPPRTETEGLICSVWADLLGLEKVGIHDNFFELGGHSLLAIQVISRLREALQAEVSVHTLFDRPTVAEFSQAIVQGAATASDQDQQVMALLELVENLSEEEVRRLLEESGGMPPEA